MRYLFFLALLILIYTQQQPKLVFIQQVFRHGARFPEKTLYPNLNDLFAKQEMSLGELTSQGRSMHYLLGKKMYNTYWKKLFSGTPYQNQYNQSRFYFRSTNVNRTIESAESHLYGILESLPPLIISKEQTKFSNPPYPGIQAKPGYVFGQTSKFYRPAAVHVDTETMTPTDQGDFLATFMANDCPNQANWMKQNNQNQTALKMLNNQGFLKALRQIESALNLPINTITINNFYNYYDGLKCMQYLGKEIPSILIQPTETKRSFDALKSLSSFITFFYNEQQIKASSTGFFQATVKNLKDYINNNPNSPQWIIYSAHDITLGMILAAMDMWNADCIYQNYLKNITDPDRCVTTFPQFATVMVFELYQYSDKTYSIKINYNGRYLQMPFCNYNTQCSVDKFEKWFNSWKVADVRLACGVFHKYRTQIVNSFIGSISALIIILIINYLIPKKTKNKILRIFISDKIKPQ